MAELYVQSLSSGKKMWLGVEEDGKRDIKPKIEPKSESDDQEHNQSIIDNAHQLPTPNAPIDHPLDSVSFSVPLAISSPNLPTSSAGEILPLFSSVSVATEGQGTMNDEGDSMMMAVADKGKEKSATDELQKWKEEANKRESQLKDRLLESKDALIAMMEKYGELDAKLKQKKEALAIMEKRGVGGATMESAVQTDSMENAKETPPTEQQSRAARAAQLLGVPCDISEPPNEWKDRCEELERNLEAVKRLYRAEQTTTAALRGELMELGRKVKTEGAVSVLDVDTDSPNGWIPAVKEAAIIQLEDTAESNEMVTSPVDPGQLQGQRRRQKEQKRMREMNATTISSDIQLAVSDEQQQREGYGNEVTAEKRIKTTTMRDSTLGNRLPVAGRQSIVVGGRRMVLRQRRLPAVASAGGEKKLANPINVASGAFPCEKCPQHVAFTSAQLLEHHQQRRHSARHRHPCDQCALSFTLTGDLNRHKKRVHSGGLKPFTCSFCTKSFAIKGDWEMHKRVHTGERPHVCAVCQKAFATSSDLRKHERTHTGEKQFCCKHCGKKFNGSGHCLDHQKICSQRIE